MKLKKEATDSDAPAEGPQAQDHDTTAPRGLGRGEASGSAAAGVCPQEQPAWTSLVAAARLPSAPSVVMQDVQPPAAPTPRLASLASLAARKPPAAQQPQPPQQPPPAPAGSPEPSDRDAVNPAVYESVGDKAWLLALTTTQRFFKPCLFTHGVHNTGKGAGAHWCRIAATQPPAAGAGHAHAKKRARCACHAPLG
jgi:hypothetical protein